MHKSARSLYTKYYFKLFSGNQTKAGELYELAIEITAEELFKYL